MILNIHYSTFVISLVRTRLICNWALDFRYWQFYWKTPLNGFLLVKTLAKTTCTLLLLLLLIPFVWHAHTYRSTHKRAITQPLVTSSDQIVVVVLPSSEWYYKLHLYFYLYFVFVVVVNIGQNGCLTAGPVYVLENKDSYDSLCCLRDCECYKLCLNLSYLVTDTNNNMPHSLTHSLTESLTVTLTLSLSVCVRYYNPSLLVISILGLGIDLTIYIYKIKPLSKFSANLYIAWRRVHQYTVDNTFLLILCDSV